MVLLLAILLIVFFLAPPWSIIVLVVGLNILAVAIGLPRDPSLLGRGGGADILRVTWGVLAIITVAALIAVRLLDRPGPAGADVGHRSPSSPRGNRDPSHLIRSTDSRSGRSPPCASWPGSWEWTSPR